MPAEDVKCKMLLRQNTYPSTLIFLFETLCQDLYKNHSGGKQYFFKIAEYKMFKIFSFFFVRRHLKYGGNITIRTNFL